MNLLFYIFSFNPKLEPYYYFFYKIQPFTSWLAHLLIFISAVKLKTYIQNKPIAINVLFFKIIRVISLLLFVFILCDYCVLRLFFNIYFKNVFLEENIYLIIFLLLDFTIIPFLTKKEDVIMGKKIIISKIDSLQTLYFLIRFYYIRFIKIRIIITVAVACLTFPFLFLGISPVLIDTSYPSFEYYHASINELKLQKETAIGSSIEVNAVSSFLGMKPVRFQYEYYVNTDGLFKQCYFKTCSVKHYIMHDILKKPAKILFKVGAEHEIRLVLNDAQYLDSVYFKNIPKNKKINVYRYYYYDYKNGEVDIIPPNFCSDYDFCDRPSRDCYIYAAHELTVDSIDYPIINSKNLVDVSNYNYYKEKGVYSEYTRAIFRPIHLDY